LARHGFKYTTAARAAIDTSAVQIGLTIETSQLARELPRDGRFRRVRASRTPAGVAFRWKDYRIDGPGRWKTMRLHPHEFIRRFLLHVLPRAFHRIRHYGLFANANRAESIATARAFLHVAQAAPDPQQQPDIPPDGRRSGGMGQRSTRGAFTKGQKAMGYAMLFPVAPTAQERGARKGQGF
jgi:hypothetical protein